MYDNVAAWMIAGGPRDAHEDPRNGRHRIAIREARLASKALGTGFVDRLRSRIGTQPAPQAADCACA